MAATHTLPLASPGMARICLYGDLQRFGRRIDLRVKTGAEAIRALATQLPAFRQKLSDGWYQVRIAGRDVSTSGLTAQLHETLPDGAVIHIVPESPGPSQVAYSRLSWGLPPLPDHSLPPEPPLQHGGQPPVGRGMTGILFSLGASMVLGGVAQMLAPKARTPRTQTTDNGKQNTYFSSLDSAAGCARAMFCLFCTGKCAWGHAWFLRRSARQTKGTVVRLW